MPAGGSCLLGAMNLSAYYDKSRNIFKYDEFGDDVRTAVRFLNEVLDEGQPLHPLAEQRDTVARWRQIGLGFMGLADLLIKMKLTYGSDKDTLDLIHHIGYVMIFNAMKESACLAKEKGAFSECNSNAIINTKFFDVNIVKNPYIDDQEIKDLVIMIKEYGIRNSQLLTCAPTGTISTILNISGGIEPIFALSYTRTTKSIHDTDRTYLVYPNAIKDYLDENNLTDIPYDFLPPYIVTSRDISWKGRIDVQAAWQKHIDASISATINLPEDTTVDEIAKLYIYGHNVGLKGTTVFRENCKRIAILNDTSSSKKKEEPDKKQSEDLVEFIKDLVNSKSLANDILKNIQNDKFEISEKDGSLKLIASDKKTNNVDAFKKSFLSSFRSILTRSDFGEGLHGTTYYEKVACGHIYVTVNRFAGRPVEVFMQSSKSGGCAANTEALGRLASTMLRAGIDPNIVIDSTLGVKCAACSTMKGKGEKISGLSCSDVMARVIRNEWNKYLNGDYDNEIEEYLSSIPADERDKYDSVDKNDLKKLSTELNSRIGRMVKDAFNQTARKESDKISGWNYKEHTVQENIDHSICPECGARLRFSEGCMKCDNCGFSKC